MLSHVDGQVNYIAMLSGGLASYFAALRANERGPVVMLFADTKTEDEDTYRFLDDIERLSGIPTVRVADGRDIWQVFRDVRFLGNSRIDPCSRILKRELLRKWLETNRSSEDTTVVLGFGWDEAHRVKRALPHWEPWTIWAPMTEAPYWGRLEMVKAIKAQGIEPPRLYALGFPHNNCGGFCVKAGQAQFRLLWQTMPERYLQHEAKEQALREYLGADVSILKDRRGGTTKPLTLKAFREQLEASNGGQCDAFDWGACSCFDLEVA